MTIVDVKFVKLCEEAKIPTYATDGSVGMDFYALTHAVIFPNSTFLMRTGIKMQLPKNTEMVIRQRSGISLKFPNYIAISVGTIDNDYTGEIKIPLVNHRKDTKMIVNPGDKIAQGIIHPIYKANLIQVEKLEETIRGEGGFGHTGN